MTYYAKAEVIWYDDYDTHFGNKIGEGAEAIVYATDDEYVTKVNDLIFHETPLEFLDRIALHNYLFPEAPYTVVGFTCRKDTGNFAVILQQPFVIAERGAVRAEVRAEMQKRGYQSIGGNDYINSNYIIQDLHPGNVLITPNGNYAFIDPIIYLNTPSEGYGGSRIAGDWA